MFNFNTSSYVLNLQITVCRINNYNIVLPVPLVIIITIIIIIIIIIRNYFKFLGLYLFEAF